MFQEELSKTATDSDDKMTNKHNFDVGLSLQLQQDKAMAEQLKETLRSTNNFYVCDDGFRGVRIVPIIIDYRPILLPRPISPPPTTLWGKIKKAFVELFSPSSRPPQR